MKKLLLLLTVLFVSIGMMAGVVTQQQALQKAKAFMQGKKIQTGQLRMAAGSSSGASSYYVFNTEGKDGFVIVSGDDRTDAILGYADSGEMDLTKLPENVKAWLDGYDRQIKALGDAQVNSKPRATMAPVPYLIKTTWSQGNPYNQQCPEYNGELCVTGCVATAMAQVMYYYKYPTAAVNGVAAYTTRGGLSVPELGSTTFDWANMRTTYSGGESTTDPLAQAVANLMRYCGQLVEMDYNPKGSGASTEDIPRMKAWGYTDAAVVYRSSYEDQETWESVIHNQLKDKRPVLYGGNANKGGGHQFICDGYDGNGLFHINWGWGGNCDGYFLLTVLNPDINQVGYNYNEDENYINQDAVINLQPNNGTMPVPSLEGTEFTSRTVEGVEMNFVITFDDATNGTCAVSRHNDGSYRRCIDTGYTGEVTIPSTVSYGERSYQVTEIGTYAFEDCEMTSLKIPSSVKYIRDSAISWCYGLTTLNIPAGVTSISPSALYSSTNISKLTVDANSMTFEDAGCNVIIAKGTGKLVLGLKCSTIPASATEIGESAFQYIQNMNITIPKTIVTIGAYAFGDCTGSVFTVEHETPIEIDPDAFNGASWSNMVLKVPAGAKSLYQNAIGWSSFQEKNIFEGDEGTEFSATVNGMDMWFTILSDNAKTVKVGRLAGSSDNNAIDKNTQATSIGVPETVNYKGAVYTVTAVGDYAFCNISNMQQLSLPSSIVSIGNNAFCDNYNLRALTIPENVSVIGNYAFSNCRNLTTLTVDPNNVKYDSRDNCNAVIEKSETSPKLIAGTKNTVIPASVKEIGEGAFRSIYDLKITIPATVTVIGNNAFAYCQSAVITAEYTDLTAVSVDWWAFNGAGNSWNNMTLRVPEGMKEAYLAADGWNMFLEKNVFEGDEGTEFKASVNGVDMWFTILSDNDNAKTVKVGRQEGSRENTAIDKNTQATSIVVPETVNYNNAVYKVTAVGDYAFYDISRMQQISLPSAIESIGDYAFCDNSYLRALMIPEKVSAIGIYAFSNCSNLAALTVDPNNVKYDSRDNCNAIIETVSDKLVVGVKISVIPASVKEIGEGAFRSIYDLKITIPATVTVIGNNAFAYCRSAVITAEYTDLTAVSVDRWAFNGAGEDWYNMTLRVPAGTKDAYLAAEGWNLFPSENIFDGNAGAEFTATVSGVDMWFTILDDNAKTVKVGHVAGSYNPAVDRNISQTSIEIPATVTYNNASYNVTVIGDYAFYDISNLQKVDMPATITSIGNYAFADCYRLNQIEIPSTVTSIGNQAFSWCSSLTSLVIPENVSTIGESAFFYTSSLSSLTVSAGNQTYYGDNAIIEKKTKKLIKGIKNTVIPPEVTEIGYSAFRSVEGLVVTIPSSVTIFGREAFAYCTSSVITAEYENPFNIDTSVFEGTGSNGSILKVPVGTKEKYLAKAGWNMFNPDNILEGDAGEEFTTTVDGIDMWFTILDAKTVKVGRLAGSEENTAIDKNTQATSIGVPETVSYNNADYTVTAVGDYAFCNISNMQQLSLPSTIESIGNYAFYDNSNLRAFTIPEKVSAIGNYAFSNCRNLAALTVDPNNVKYDSRDNCNAIIETASDKLVVGTKNTVIPASVKEIGEGAFRNVNDLKITIPVTVTVIGYNAFAYCQSSVITAQYTDLTAVSVNSWAFDGAGSSWYNMKLRVPAGMKDAYLDATGWNLFPSENILEGNAGEEFTVNVSGVDMWFTILDDNAKTVKVGRLEDSWENMAIDRNTQTTSIVVPETVNYNNADYTVTAIGSYAFRNVWNLQYINMPETITEIGYYAFGDCYQLKQAKLPSALTTLGDYAFAWCGLTSITIPKSLSSIGNNVFYDCDNISSLTVEDGNQTYYGNNAIIEKGSHKLILGINGTIIPEGVSEIGEGAFRGVRGLTLTIPVTVTTIGDRAFADCQSSVITVGYTDLSKVNVGSYAFDGAGESSNEMKLRVPAGMKATYLATEGWSAYLPENVLEGNAGEEFTETVSVGKDGEEKTVSMTFTILSDGDQKTVKIGPLAGSWDKTAISKQTAHTDIILPSSVVHEGVTYTITEIGAYAFCNITSLQQLQLPATITSIGDYAFQDCYQLESLEIPKAVTKIGSRILGGCGNIQSFTIEEENEYYEAPDGCNALIEKATHKLLYGTRATKKIPDTVVEIAANAFENYSNLTISIPTSVTKIGNNAFAWCSNSTFTVAYQDPMPVSQYAFRGAASNGSVLRVPDGTKAKYLATEGWMEFGEDNIMEGNAGEEFTEPLTVTLTADNGDVTEYDVDVTFTVTGSDGEYQTVKVGPLNGNYSNTAINNQTIKNGSVITIPVSIKHNNVDYCITAIGDYAFREKQFSKIILPEGITTIGERAFQDCNQLTELTIPASVTSIGIGAFIYCRKLEFSVASGNKTYKVNSGALIETATKTLVAGTEKTTGIPVGIEAIGECAFYNINNLHLTIPASVRWIGANAFLWSHSSVFTVESENPADCDESAFYGADEANCILKVPAGSKKNYLAANGWNKFLSENVFEGNEGLEFTAWIDGVPMIFTVTDASSDIQKVKLGRMAGTYQNAIDYSQDFDRDMTQPIVIPSSVSYEGTDYQVTAVGAYGLYYAPFSSVTLPETITRIGNYAFRECENLISMTIPSGVTSIGDYAFMECYNLISMTIPSSVTSIGNGAFIYCNNLATLTVDAKNPVYDSRNNCNAIIETASHRLIVGIKGSKIPETVTQIGSGAFVNIPDLEITIPEAVTYIDEGAFDWCYNLVLTVKSKTPQGCDYDAFWGVEDAYTNSKLRVPKGTKDAYAAAQGWSRFLTIEEYDDSYKKGDANGDGVVDVADVVAVVNYILGKASGNFNEAAANINGDDVVDVADVVGIVNIILGKSYARGDEAVLDEFTANDRLRLTKSDHLLTISLDNNGSYVAAQFDVRIPEGQSIEAVIINRDRAQGHQAVYAEIGENLYRVVVYTIESEAFAGHSGELLSIRFADAAEGVEIDNIKFVTRSMGIKTFAPLNGETTGMAALGLMQEPADVYSLNGRLVKKQATSLEGLPKGVYIIRGRKVVK